MVQPIIAPIFAPNTLIDTPQDLVQSKELPGSKDRTQAAPIKEFHLNFLKSDLSVETRSPELKNKHINGDNKPLSKSDNSRDLPKTERLNINNSDSKEPNKPYKDVFILEQNQKNMLENLYNAQKDVSGSLTVIDKPNTTQKNITTALEVQHTGVSTSNAQMRFQSQNIATPASPQSAPTIQVTIGRIEVRAISPPVTVAAVQRPRTPSPSLSLDEYLKQRNGGQR